jgi:hypothetical protein
MYWTSNLKSDTKFICIHDNVFYIANPKPTALDSVITDFKYHNTPPTIGMGIPFNYIHSIRLYEGKNMIELNFRDSTEEIIISDPVKKEEVFVHLRNAIPGFKYYVDTYSKLRAGKKPLIAMLVIIGLFLWSFFIAYETEHGTLYDVEGQHYHSIAGIILVLANLGTLNLILIFGILLVITLIIFFNKIKQPTVVRVLTR